MPTRLLLTAALRELARQPLQFALAVLGIALGVAVVLAVRLATASALDGFERAADALGGRTTALLAGPAGVPDDLALAAPSRPACARPRPSCRAGSSAPMPPGAGCS